MSPLFGHSWGWDELLLFAVPVVLAVLAVRWAERRAARKRADEAELEDAPDQEDP